MPETRAGLPGLRHVTCRTRPRSFAAVYLYADRADTRRPARFLFTSCLETRGYGASRARTGDLLAASQTLSQLSYGPVLNGNCTANKQ